MQITEFSTQKKFIFAFKKKRKKQKNKNKKKERKKERKKEKKKARKSIFVSFFEKKKSELLVKLMKLDAIYGFSDSFPFQKCVLLYTSE